MEFAEYLRFVFAFIFVLSLMGILAYVLRRWGPNKVAAGPGKRLSVLEVKAIDARHRLALIKCDETEHLLVLSPDGQTVVQSHKKAAS